MRAERQPRSRPRWSAPRPSRGGVLVSHDAQRLVERGGPRHAFIDLLAELPDAKWDVLTQIFEGDTLLIEWTAESSAAVVKDGTDIIVFDGDLIRLQTVCYTLERRG